MSFEGEDDPTLEWFIPPPSPIKLIFILLKVCYCFNGRIIFLLIVFVFSLYALCGD
jgi:hypothetical protein